jgi:uncharacterized protein
VKTQTQLVIDRPERWAKQLASHLGHKAEVITEGNRSVISFGFGGTGVIDCSETAVLLSAEASEQESLDRIKHIMGSHLLRFAKLEDTHTLSWF